LIPIRRSVWVNGGNRPVSADPFNHEVGQIFLRVGIHSDKTLQGGLVWRVLDAGGKVVATGAGAFHQISPLISKQVAEIEWCSHFPGEYRLITEFSGAVNSWPIWVSDRFCDNDEAYWTTDDPMGHLGFQSSLGSWVLSTRCSTELRPGLVLLVAEGTVAKPFWREAAYEFRNNEFWFGAPFKDKWERFLAISPDRVLDPLWLDSLPASYEILLNRVDVRSYEEHPVLVRIGDTFISSLRPFGGLASQPIGIPRNPAGAEFVRSIARSLTK